MYRDGWTHKVIEILNEQNIVRKEGGYVTIADVKNLLNGVAWERPLKNLQEEELFVNFTGAHVAAQEITRALKEQKIPFAFTSYTSGWTLHVVCIPAGCYLSLS